jgi:hypothetical protein
MVQSLVDVVEVFQTAGEALFEGAGFVNDGGVFMVGFEHGGSLAEGGDADEIVAGWVVGLFAGHLF